MEDDKTYQCNFTCEDFRAFSVLCQRCGATGTIACSITNKCTHCIHEFSKNCNKENENG